jgi:oxepin-CoA hydrolase/3-oxo-5,6-dehydrosuberyl-CoA semialdehyde dehydrogenase
MSPILLLNQQPMSRTAVHESGKRLDQYRHLCLIVVYKKPLLLVKLGKGSLVSSIVTNDTRIATEYTLGAGPYHGRILVLNRTCGKDNTGHGSPLPVLVRGGTGEELVAR